MKKLLAFLLACMMTTCAFASCGDDDDDDDKGKKSSKSSKVSDDDEDDDDDDDDEEEETTKKKRRESSVDDDEDSTEDTTEADEDTFKMPDLVGMDVYDAYSTYGSQLAFEIDGEEYSDEDEDVIIWQDIKTGKKVNKGDTVHIKVSKGAEPTTEPATSAQSGGGSSSSSSYIYVSDDGLLCVNCDLFGKSVSEMETLLKTDLGSPEDFPWWMVHQNLYYYPSGDYTFLLFFNDYDELDVIQLDEKCGFKDDVVDAAKQKYSGVNCIVSTGNYSDIYEFQLTQWGVTYAIYEELYSETYEYYFRQAFTSGLYYYD